MLQQNKLVPGLIFFNLLLFAQTAAAEIFKWTDAEGNLHFSDTPPEQTRVKKITVKPNSYKSVQDIQSTGQLTNKRNNAPTQKTVLMYSAEWCGVCRKAKRYFKKNRIPYRDFDIDKNQQAKQRYKALNAHGIPVIFVNDMRLNGFSVAQFERVYYRE